MSLASILGTYYTPDTMTTRMKEKFDEKHGTGIGSAHVDPEMQDRFLQDRVDAFRARKANPEHHQVSEQQRLRQFAQQRGVNGLS